MRNDGASAPQLRLPCATLIGYDGWRAEIRGTDGWPANNGLSHKGAELLSTIQVGMQAFVQLAQGVPPVVLMAVETLRPRLPHYVCAEGHQSRYRSSGAVVSPDHQMSGSQTVCPRMEDTNTP